MKALKKIFNKQNIKKFSQVIAATDKKTTTRKHYPGQYRIELVANGKTLAETSFQLKT